MVGKSKGESKSQESLNPICDKVLGREGGKLHCFQPTILKFAT